MHSTKTINVTISVKKSIPSRGFSFFLAKRQGKYSFTRCANSVRENEKVYFLTLLLREFGDLFVI